MREMPICKKCLLRDLDWPGYFQTLRDYIQNIPEEEKVPDAEYERRLAVCRECAWLSEGMCRMCGCYVELRAAMRVRGCPSVPGLWGAYPKE